MLGIAGGDSVMISGSESRSESRGSQGNEMSVDGPRPKRLLGKHSICICSCSVRIKKLHWKPITAFTKKLFAKSKIRPPWFSQMGAALWDTLAHQWPVFKNG